MPLYVLGLLAGILLYPVLLLYGWWTRNRRQRWLRRRGLGFLA